MEIEILGTESLGVRGLCCFVKTKNREILIDPGIALGYKRSKLLPHPFQVAVDEKIQKKIIQRWSEATDIVISHFHGDHVPLTDANPYQLNIEKVSGLNSEVKIWAKSYSLSKTEDRRAISISFYLNKDLIAAEGKESGVMSFSIPVPHGEVNNNLDTVTMTRIEEDYVFVHASDIQLLNDESISQILSWHPDIVLISGPPIYLSRLSEEQVETAWNRAIKLSQKVDTLILDHHLLRNYSGLNWLDKLANKTKTNIVCAADFMKKPRLLLEAQRKSLYEKMPVPERWHESYAESKVNTNRYWNLGRKFYKI